MIGLLTALTAVRPQVGCWISDLLMALLHVYKLNELKGCSSLANMKCKVLSRREEHNLGLSMIQQLAAGLG